jgi:hypothetical protein
MRGNGVQLARSRVSISAKWVHPEHEPGSEDGPSGRHVLPVQLFRPGQDPCQAVARGTRPRARHVPSHLAHRARVARTGEPVASEA